MQNEFKDDRTVQNDELQGLAGYSDYAAFSEACNSAFDVAVVSLSEMDPREHLEDWKALVYRDFVPQGLRKEQCFMKHADCFRVAANGKDYLVFDKSTEALAAELASMPDYTRVTTDQHWCTAYVYGYPILASAHVELQHTKNEAGAKVVKQRLELQGEVLVKAVGVTTDAGGLHRWSTLKQAEEVLGFPDFASGAFLAAFSGVDAHMQVRRIEELVHRDVCNKFEGQLQFVGFCTNSSIPHNELFECCGDLSTADVLQYSRDRHAHWLDKAAGAFKFYTPDDFQAAFSTVRQSKPLLWDHGVDRRWFADCGCTACKIGLAAQVSGERYSVKESQEQESVTEEAPNRLQNVSMPAPSRYPPQIPVVTFHSSNPTNSTRTTSTKVCLPLRGPQGSEETPGPIAGHYLEKFRGSVWVRFNDLTPIDEAEEPIAGSGAEEAPAGRLVTEFTDGNKEYGVEDDLKVANQEQYGRFAYVVNDEDDEVAPEASWPRSQVADRKENTKRIREQTQEQYPLLLKKQKMQK